MKIFAAALCLLAAGAVSSVSAQEGSVPKGVPHLDHVFVIMMENHAYKQVIGNPNMPFTNKYAKQVNSAEDYFAVGHPSLTNYLEIVGGSNFGIRNDNSPDWHSSSCTPNIIGKTVSLEGATALICPIYGTGTDGATPAIDYSNETSGPPGVIDVNGVIGYAANPNTVGETIADQLVNSGLTWKSYQESLPPTGADEVNLADGLISNLIDIPTVLPALSNSSLIGLYAVKHNPFAYFQNIEEGLNPELSLKRMAGFGGPGGLYADLASDHVPSFSFVVPNQCDDQHGRSNAGPECESDPNDNGTLVGLNPALMYQGDVTLQTLVTTIHESKVWQNSNSAIVVVWDENDYSVSPTTNQVLLTVDTSYGPQGVHSKNLYTSFSLLKSVEAGFRLPCLNHACDSSTNVMSDLFAAGDGDHDADDK